MGIKPQLERRVIDGNQLPGTLKNRHDGSTGVG